MTTTASQTNIRSFKGVDIPEPGTFAIDTSHSSVGFTVRHLVVAKTKGRFADFAGNVTIADDPLQSSVAVTIQSASIQTADEQRDGHLRSADFFDVENYPTLTFTSTSVQHKGGSQFAVAGDLTVRDITRPVTLDLDYEGVVTDPWGGQRAVFSARTKINREEFGLTWNQALETGGVLVGKDVSIELEIEAVRQ
jgi:polyisoprenoid-binding protein YceI